MSEWTEAGDPAMGKAPDDLPDELTMWHGGPPNERAERIEWREGWWWFGAVGVDWREWRIDAGIGFKVGRSVGASLYIGPFYVYGGWEFGNEAFENGKRTGMGVGPV